MTTNFHTVDPGLARQLEAQPIALEGIRLSAGGAGWMGTFYGALRFALEDLASDGAPTRVRLLVEGDGENPVVVDGDLLNVEDHFARFADGAAVDLNDVTGLWVW